MLWAGAHLKVGTQVQVLQADLQLHPHIIPLGCARLLLLLLAPEAAEKSVQASNRSVSFVYLPIFTSDVAQECRLSGVI